MIRLYYKDGSNFTYENPDSTKTLHIDELLWIDMVSPGIDEIGWIENHLNITLPSPQEREEIELTSRYWEEEHYLTINSSFFIQSSPDEGSNESMSFVIKDDFIVTVRFTDLISFDEITKRYLSNPRVINNGFEFFSLLIDIRVDLDADMLEKLVRKISTIRKEIMETNKVTDDTFKEISKYESSNMRLRENLMDKQRILTSLVKSRKVPDKMIKEFRITLDDVKSLIEHTEFNFDRIDYVQDIALAAIAIEQSTAVKVFTIVSVVFMPPTLIASVYGMNFAHMPELNEAYAYPIALFAMLLSAIIPIVWFKKKGWI